MAVIDENYSSYRAYVDGRKWADAGLKNCDDNHIPDLGFFVVKAREDAERCYNDEPRIRAFIAGAASVVEDRKHDAEGLEVLESPEEQKRREWQEKDRKHRDNFVAHDESDLHRGYGS